MNTKSLKALVIDDEKVVRDVLIRFLDLMGIKAKEAENGFKAIEMAKKEHFDIIFTELKMPGIDGAVTLRELKKIAPSAKYVMMSSNDVQNKMEEAKKQGVHTCLKKPFDLDELRSLIKGFMA